MTNHTTNYGFPYGELTDTPDGATQVENLAIAIDTQVKTNANTAAAATVAAAARSVLLATLMGTAGTRYTDFTTSQTVASLTVNTYTTVVDTAGTPNICGHTFVAPPSGIVEFEWGANPVSGTTSSTVFMGVQVNQGGVVGSGTVQSAVNDNEAFNTNTTARLGCTRSRVLTGLTAGNTYNVRIMWRNSGSTTSGCTTPWLITKPVIV